MTDERDVFRLWRAMLSRRLGKNSREALEVYENDCDLYAERVNAAQLLTEKDAQKLLACDLTEARITAEICERTKISFITKGSEAYPAPLRSLKEPPELLFCLGDPSVLARPACAVIGSRNADDYSFRLTRRFAYEFARADISVVSGFAVGIDRAAHFGALDAKGTTVAVLGCGILCDYPRGSARIRDAITERGAVITEYLPYQRPEASFFPMRNRITAALSRCVLCTLAGRSSGSLNTANHAFSLGLPVYVTPPHDLLDGSSDGIVTLLRDGAVQVCSPQEIIREVFL